MINLSIGTNTSRKDVIVTPEETLAAVLNANNVDFSHAALHLNGTHIAGVDTQKSFTDLGIQDGGKAMLIAVIKADSAK